MLLLVSGEGPSDIGTNAPGAEGPEFVPGPMTILLDRLIEQVLQYSLLDCGYIRFVAKAELTAVEPKHRGRQLRIPGKRKEKETGYYFENARRLAEMAQSHASVENDAVIPVLFRDADGTQSAGRGQWQDQWDSMLKGFREAGAELGIPMLPKPKSEAWLLCACKPQPYQHCAQLEDESGNDRCSNPLKDQLETALQGASSARELADMVRNGQIDPLQIDMPSYNAFRQRLDEVLAHTLHPTC